MKTAVNNNLIQTLEMSDIFEIEIVNNKKRVSRWGFFAKLKGDQYAIYRPERPICQVHELFMIEEDGPGTIEIVSKDEIQRFVSAIGGNINGVVGMEVSDFTPCGWYYDKIV
jgi:hypothetical protein